MTHSRSLRVILSKAERMKFLLRLFLVFVLMCVLASDALASKPKILLIKDLEPGTKAIGFSVFKGVEPQPFNVVLGELMDQMGNSFILARISGGPMDTPLEKIGAISGMSGSPIFMGCSDLPDCVKNGTLVGALSYSIGSFIEGGMNCLLTPAEYMLGARVGGYVMAGQFSNRMPDKIYFKGREFVNLMLFPKMDNLTVQGGSLGKCGESVDSELKPGSMVSVFLAKGLIPVAASGTVTWRDDENIYIFGHPFFGTGMINYPCVHVAVADIIQTPVNAYKISGCYLNTEGAMLIDGVFEMAGIIGRTAPTIPLRVEAHLNDGVGTLDEEVVPSPMARMIINKLPVMWIGQLMGDLSYLSLAYQVRVGIQDNPEIFLKSIIPAGVEKEASDSKNPFEQLFNRVDSVFENLEKNGHNYKVESFKIHVDFVKNLKVWTKKTAFLSQNKATPGETVYVNVILEEVSSGATQQVSIPVRVPDDFMERLESGASSNITVLVQSGINFTNKKRSVEATSIEDIIKQLNQDMNYKTNVLYVQQVMPRSKAEQKTDKDNAKMAVKPVWKWTDVGEGDLKQLPSGDGQEVTLNITPVLDHFIDFDTTFNIMVQATKNEVIVVKKETKKRKWFIF